jgi:uncharacterized protein YuzE
MTLVFRSDRIKESDEIRPGIIIDYGYEGQIIRIEVLNASSMLENAKEMQFAVEG